MKISDMTNDQAAEALIRLSVPFGNICEDEAAMNMIEEYKNLNKAPLIQTIGKLLPQVISYILKSHKDDLYEIIGSLTFKSKAAVAKMNFVETVKVVRESYDEVLQSFFTSSVKQIKESGEKLSQA